MRLIDADAVKKQAITLVTGARTWEVVTVSDLDNAPTVDTTCPNCDSGYAQGYSDGYLKGKEEKPQGEWIDIYSSHIAYMCSNCGLQTPICDYYHFCPNCGTEMTKEAENNES